MAQKLIWTELRKALASRAGVSEKEANLFLNAFNAQIIEALKQDKQVKINGLGTFKLQTVAPRKSVNVTSGEEITIDSYNKIAFAPEIGVKELIEKISDTPAHKEVETATAADIDPLQKLGEQAAEIVDILADLGQSPQTEEQPLAKPVEEPEPATEEQPIEEPATEEEPITEEPVAEIPTITEPVIIEPTEPEPVVEEPVIEPKKEKAKKKYHFVRDTIICMLVLILLLGVGYFFLRQQLSAWIDSLAEKGSVTTEQVVSSAENSIIAVDTIASEQESKEQNTERIIAEPMYEELITIEPMHEASRLTWMAKRYYGEKIFWLYLYDANKDHITNPNQIETGTPIRVPKLTAEQMDTTLESTRLILQHLQEQAEAASKK